MGTSTAYLEYAPGLAILLTVLAVNFVGNGFHDAPRGGGRFMNPDATAT